MEWWTVLLLALVCSLPAAFLLWSALYMGKRADDEAEQEDTPAPNISTQPMSRQTH